MEERDGVALVLDRDVVDDDREVEDGVVEERERDVGVVARRCSGV